MFALAWLSTHAILVLSWVFELNAPLVLIYFRYTATQKEASGYLCLTPILNLTLFLNVCQHYEFCKYTEVAAFPHATLLNS